MRFRVAGSRIICSRKDNTASDDRAYRQVVDFDAHVDTIPPHVEAKLTQGELRELKAFLADRKRIQANPATVNMLEALPDLIEETIEILDSVDQLNVAMYRRLRKSVARLTDALQEVKPRNGGELTLLRNMRGREALKERLKNLKQNL